MPTSRRALDAPGVPVLQVVSATTKRAAWRDSARGLGAADLAMHVVLPELDGRVLAGAVAFKDPLPPQDGLAFTALASRPEPDRIAMVADRIAALVRLRALPRGERRVADPDAGLSRRTGPHRLCGRPRCAGERDRAARRSCRRRLRGERRAEQRRAICSMRCRAAATTRR